MRKLILGLSFMLLFSGFLTKPLFAAPKVKTPLLSVDVNLSPAPTTNPAPSSAPQTTPVPSPTSQPLPSPTSVPVTPTSAPEPIKPPKAIPTPEPEKKDVSDTITLSIGQIMSQIEDTPTPTPTPEPVEVIQQVVPDEKTSDKNLSKFTQAHSPEPIMQNVIGPSASFFLHSIPGNYYLINSLSRPESFGLLTIAFLLLGSGVILLYKTQREDILRTLESFFSHHIYSFWIRNKHIFYTIFDRDYAK